MVRTSIISLCVAVAASGMANANTLVNIQGYGDGITSGSGANIHTYPVAVGTTVTLQNPVLVNLAAGDYLLSDAWGQSGALYDAWNFQSSAPGSWSTHYVVAELGADSSYTVLLDQSSIPEPSCANHFCAYSTEAEAAAAFLATPAASLHLDHAATLAFVSADYHLQDNLGGISLNVEAVPIPATAWLFGSGAIALVALSRKRNGESLELS